MSRESSRSASVLRRAREKESALRTFFWRRWHNPARVTTPVFLVGCGRSGTTMLVRKLAESWQIELFNENNADAFENWRLREWSVIEDLTSRSDAPVALFKPILDTYRTPSMLSRFASAKVVFAFRHYDDVVNSMLKMKRWRKTRLEVVNSWVNGDFADFANYSLPSETKEFIRSRWSPSLSLESGAALFWLFYNRLFFDLKLDVEKRVRPVRYEAIVARPRKELEALCLFLNIEYDPAMVEGIFSTSVKRDSPHKIDAQIREDCEELWHHLCLREETGNPNETLDY